MVQVQWCCCSSRWLMTDIPKQTKIANKFSWTSTAKFRSQTLIFMVKSNNFFYGQNSFSWSHNFMVKISWSVLAPLQHGIWWSVFIPCQQNSWSPFHANRRFHTQFLVSAFIPTTLNSSANFQSFCAPFLESLWEFWLWKRIQLNGRELVLAVCNLLHK